MHIGAHIEHPVSRTRRCGQEEGCPPPAHCISLSRRLEFRGDRRISAGMQAGGQLLRMLNLWARPTSAPQRVALLSHPESWAPGSGAGNGDGLLGAGGRVQRHWFIAAHKYTRWSLKRGGRTRRTFVPPLSECHAKYKRPLRCQGPICPGGTLRVNPWPCIPSSGAPLPMSHSPRGGRRVVLSTCSVGLSPGQKCTPSPAEWGSPG